MLKSDPEWADQAKKTSNRDGSDLLLTTNREFSDISPPEQGDPSRVSCYLFSLKLGNLFLNENMEIKLGDFGLATRL